MTAVTWIDVDDVLTVGNNDTLDAEQGGEFLIQVTAAANEWAYRKRQQAGYADIVAQAPSEDVKLGTALVAWEWYQETRNVVGASFDDFPDPVLAGTGMGNVKRLLGVPRGAVA